MLSEIIDLLTSLFSEPELRQWCSSRDWWGLIEHQAFAPGAFVEQVAKLAGMLQRRGLIDDALFADLSAARPRRAKDIEKVKAAWNMAQQTHTQREREKEDWWIGTLRQQAFEPIAVAIAPFLALASANPNSSVDNFIDRYLAAITGIFLDDGKRKVFRERLRHSATILQYLQQLAPLATDPSVRPHDLCIRTPGQALLAAAAVLVHNLALIDFEIYGKPPQSYLERCEDFLSRSIHVHQRISRKMGTVAVVWAEVMEQASWVGIEMFRDSAYWDSARKRTDAGSRLHTRFDQQLRGTFAWELSIALRICEAMEIQHRAIPDLVRDLFTRAQYPQGLKCYIQHTFSRDGVPFLLAEEPELRDNRLHLVYAQLGEDSMGFAVGRAIRLLNASIRARLSALASLCNSRPNLVVSLHVTEAPETDAADVLMVRLEHLSWAFFPLAIAFPSSDTDAATALADLFPRLVSYIDKFDRKFSAHGDPSGAHNRREIPTLLRVICRLRHNSHALLRIAYLLYEGMSSYEQPVEVAERGRQEALSLLSQQQIGFQLSADVVQPPPLYLPYGASRPVAHWLAARLADHGQMEQVLIRPLYCMRKIVTDSWGSEIENRDAGFRDHRRLEKLILECLSPGGGSRADRRIDSVIDFARIPRLCRQRAQDNLGEPEILIGARSFVRSEGKAWAVATYGSHILVNIARGLGIVVRIVTQDDRLKRPIAMYERPSASGGLEFSYALVADGEAEDELVPLDEIDEVVTEAGVWSGEGASQLVHSAVQTPQVVPEIEFEGAEQER